MPGVLSGFLMAFTMSLDDFIITHFTRGAGIDTLSTLIYSEVRRGIKPSMYALSTLIFVTVLVLLIITNFSPEETKKTAVPLSPEEKCQTVKPQKEKQQYQTRCSRRGNRGNYLRGRFHHLWPLFHQALQRAVCLQLGEYIDDSVIEQFREETGIEVTYDLFETNEGDVSRH